MACMMEGGQLCMSCCWEGGAEELVGGKTLVGGVIGQLAAAGLGQHGQQGGRRLHGKELRLQRQLACACGKRVLAQQVALIQATLEAIHQHPPPALPALSCSEEES